MSDIVSAGRRVAVGLASWLAGQDRAMDNARQATTEASRRRVQREEVSIYLDGLQPPDGDDVSAEEWPGRSAKAAD